MMTAIKMFAFAADMPDQVKIPNVIANGIAPNQSRLATRLIEDFGCDFWRVPADPAFAIENADVEAKPQFRGDYEAGRRTHNPMERLFAVVNSMHRLETPYAEGEHRTHITLFERKAHENYIDALERFDSLLQGATTIGVKFTQREIMTALRDGMAFKTEHLSRVTAKVDWSGTEQDAYDNFKAQLHALFPKATMQPKRDTNANPANQHANFLQHEGKKGYGKYNNYNNDWNQDGGKGRQQQNHNVTWQINGVCNNCGGYGHMARSCPTAPQKGKGKGKEKGKGKGKGKGKKGHWANWADDGWDDGQQPPAQP
jgi:hypothetical protein